jgi:DNA end-binding protein Ku
MPAVRPYWKGYIKLALVSCPIGLWAASSSSERVAFRQINKKTGNRLRQQLIDEETRIPVEAHDKGRGYEHAKGSYLMIEDHELEAIEIVPCMVRAVGGPGQSLRGGRGEHSHG